MKVRWNARNVRLRISPSELASLGRGQTVVEELGIRGGCWRAELIGGEATALTMSHASNSMTLRFVLAAEDMAKLARPDTEGVYRVSGDGVRFYVEKDFPCAHPRASEAQEVSETFAAPPGFLERKTGDAGE